MSIRACLIALPLCLMTALGAFAQTKDRLDRRDKLLGFESVGRLDSATGHCTAVLITRDVALTAAHCVHGKGSRFVFRAGYSDGSAIATRTATDVAIAEGYLQAITRGDDAGAIAHDVALVRLSSPIFEPGADPYDIAATPRPGTALTLASYGQGRMEALTLERGCALHTLYRGGIVGIDCDATFGSSGAPVFVQDAGRTRIVSIVSSGTTAGNGALETLGVALTEIVPVLIRELQAKRSLAPINTGAKRIVVGVPDSDESGGGSGGARFVKPPKSN